MTAPQSSSDQILIKLGEMGAQLAVIVEQLKPIADHESRLRALESIDVAQIGENKEAIGKIDIRLSALEKFRYTLAGTSFAGGAIVSALGYWIGHIVR